MCVVDVLDFWFYPKMLSNLVVLLLQELISQAGQKTVHDPSHDERVRQYAKLSLNGELLEKGWCSLVPQQLKSSEHDYREKVHI